MTDTAAEASGRPDRRASAEASGRPPHRAASAEPSGRPHRRASAEASGSPHRRAYAALLLMVLIWGVNFPVAKAALDEIAPLAFNALRFPLAALTLLLALHLRGGVRWPEPAHRLRILGLGVLGNFVYQQFFIFGLDNTRAGNASILLAVTPILTALFSAAAGHERVTARTWTGVVATAAGIAVVVTLGADRSNGDASLLGDSLMIGASASWALYTVSSRDLVYRYGALPFTAWTLCIGAVGLGIIGIPAVLRTDLLAVSAGAWIGVFYAGALSIGLAYLIWYFSVARIGNTRTATYSNLVPVVAVAAAWIQLGEVPTAGQVIGAAIVIGGITLTQRRSPHEHAAARQVPAGPAGVGTGRRPAAQPDSREPRQP
jgi:drug/metabolite transporter (DMT)-like permease